jgi:hypothetical protein
VDGCIGYFFDTVCLFVVYFLCVYSSVLCTCSADLTLNGSKNIILGTYGQELLVYRCMTNAVVEEGEKEEKGNSKEDKAATREREDHPNRTTHQKDYVLDWQRTFAFPIYHITVGDFDNDGINELVITTLQGIHILKPDLNAVVVQVEETMELLEEIVQLQKQLEA